MSNNNALKTYINNTIYENNTQQITGAIMNTVLNSIVNTLGAGYQFAGVADVGMNPSEPDARVFYLASAGIYTNFGGIEVPQNKLGVLKWDTSWHLETIDGLGGGSNLTGYISVASVSELPEVGQPTLGYLIGTNLYLYVGEGGDTADGKYQNCGPFRGPAGVSVERVVQTQTSYENGGVNVIRVELENGSSFEFQVRNGSTSLGLFPSLEALQSAHPNPTVGQYAYVGTGFPADIYVCQTAGTWTDSEQDYDGDNVDLTDYATKEEVNRLEQEVDVNRMPFPISKNDNYIRREGDYSAIQRYSFKSDGTYGTGTTYYHADMLVYPGEVVVVKANSTNGARIAFVSDLDCPDSGNTYGLVAGSYTEIASGKEMSVIVPSGACAMKVYLGQLSDGAYTQKPESLFIYRAKGTVVSPSAIRMDRYQISSSKYAENDSAHGWCFPVEKGKTYTLKVSGASSGTKYNELIEGLPYYNRASSYTSFTTDTVVFTKTAEKDGVWTVFKSSGNAFSVTFGEVKDMEVADADTLATAKALNYGRVDVPPIMHLDFYIASASGLWTASSTYRCIVYPVSPGQLLKVIPNSEYNAILYWLANNNSPVAGNAPNNPAGHLERITITGETILRVPEGANYVYVYTGTSDNYVPSFFGVATDIATSEEVKAAEIVCDSTAYLDKQEIISERGYYFNDTYDTESSYVNTSYLDQKLLEVPEGKHFLFITDSHIDYSNNIGFRQDAIPIVKYVRDRLGIPNVIFGGDCIGSVKPKYQAAKILSLWAGKMFDSFGSNFLWVMGNHDANDPNGTREETISDVEIYKRTTRFMRGYGRAVFPEKLLGIIEDSNDLLDNSGNPMTDEQKKEYKAWAMLNYYYDDNLQKIRYIVLETGDCGNTMNDIFGVSGDSQNSLMTVAYFMLEAMKTIPSDYDLVVVGHWLVNNGAFWKKVFYKLCAAYKNKASVTVDFTPLTYHHPAVEPIVLKTFDNPNSLSGITVNFTDNPGSGRIFVVGGHVHYDRAMVKAYVSDNDDITITAFPLSTDPTAQSMVYGVNDVLVIVFDRSCAIGKSNSTLETIYSYPNDASYTPVAEGGVERMGTIKEVLFDVVTITDDNRVVITRFGAEGPVGGTPYVRDYVLPMMES